MSRGACHSARGFVYLELVSCGWISSFAVPSRRARLVTRLASLAALGTLGVLAPGCVDEAEPSVPCGRLAPIDPEQAAVASGPTVVALADRSGRVKVVRKCSDCAEDELRSYTLDLGDRPDQIMLTGSGDWLVYRSGDRLFKLDISQLGEPTTTDPDQLPRFDVGDGAVEIVGTLRSGDWIVFRDMDGLRAFDAAADQDLEPETARPFRLGDGSMDLRAVALGERNLVARRVLAGGDEELYLVRVNPSVKHDHGGPAGRGTVERLGRGRFSRVEITRGPTPDALGEPDPTGNLPIDEFVVATAGAGSDASTVVYRVEDGSLSDRFRGAVATSRRHLDSIPGLSAFHPSGDRIAYLTPAGSLAMRSLRSQGACLVRSAGTGEHVVAGFSADGLLYFQSEESGEGSGRNRVFAHDPTRRETTSLTPGEGSQTLAAVPAVAGTDTTGKPTPWAMTVRDGYYSMWAGEAMTAVGIDQEELRFVPRLDTGLWMLDAPVDGEEPVFRNLELTRLDTVPVGVGELELDDTPPTDATTGKAFTHQYAGAQRLCLSAARPGAWSTRCATTENPVTFMQTGLPETEQPLTP